MKTDIRDNLHTKEHQRLPANHQKVGENHGENHGAVSFTALGRKQSDQHSDLDFQVPAL